MSTATWAEPRTTRDPLMGLTNQIGYARLLAARDALTTKVRGIGTFIASTTRLVLRQAERLAEYLRLRRAGIVAVSAARCVRGKAAVALGFLRRVLTPAGAVWVLTTPTGQRLTRTVGSTALHLLESALMRGTDLALGILSRLGRPGRWAAVGIGNAAAEVVTAVSNAVAKVRSNVGPCVSPDRLHVRVVNGVAGLVFLRQLASLLPPVLRVPAMVVAMVVSLARSGRNAAARALRGLARMLADVADATFLAAGVMEGDVPSLSACSPQQIPRRSPSKSRNRQQSRPLHPGRLHHPGRPVGINVLEGQSEHCDRLHDGAAGKLVVAGLAVQLPPHRTGRVVGGVHVDVVLARMGPDGLDGGGRDSGHALLLAGHDRGEVDHDRAGGAEAAGVDVSGGRGAHLGQGPTTVML